MFKKLKLKFVLTTMILLTSMIVILLSAIYISTKRNGEYMLYSQASDTLNSIKVLPNGEVTARGRYTEDSILGAYDSKKSSIAYSTTFDIEEDDVKQIIVQALKSGKDKGFLYTDDYKYVYTSKKGPFSVDIVLQDASYHYNYMRKLMVIFIIIGVLGEGISFLVSLIMAKSAIKPVEASYNSQKRFIADASHELKTPLAVIKTNLDVLSNNQDDTIKNQKKWFKYIEFQTERMSKLVSNLLYLAKADNNEVLGAETIFNISDTIMNQILTFEAIVYENNLKIDCDIDENIQFKGDKEAINQLIGILFDNAIKHSYKDTTIKISLKDSKQKIHMYVENVGETIEAEDLEKIFERFYRVDKSRAREKGGYGLGLSIAKSIVTRYKGKIKAESNNNITKFSVEFNSYNECK